MRRCPGAARRAADSAALWGDVEGVCDCAVVCLGNEGGVCTAEDSAHTLKSAATAGPAAVRLTPCAAPQEAVNHRISQTDFKSFMMSSLSGFGWTVFCLLLLLKRQTARGEDLLCSGPGPGPGPVGARHPVQGLLERFEAGLGCAARERGDQETHVVSLGRVTNSPDNKVVVLLKPLSLSPRPLRAVHLLLSSSLPVTWILEAERLTPGLPVQVQVSSNSSVQSRGLSLNVQKVPSLPYRPRALHRWALRRHGGLSSLTHTTHGNRVYVRLGEDPTQPAVCQPQPMFLSHNYMTSDLQPQEVQGCARLPPASGAEVHVIKLHSAGSCLCGSLQVEATVSLLPPVGGWKARRVVLVLSSSVAVNWAVAARGIRGHVTVHASHSVSPPYPPEPGLTLSAKVTPDLSTAPDLLAWANGSGYAEVTSYTEADLANRFVIQLSEGGTDEASLSPVALRPTWAEERRLRQWLRGGAGGGAGGGRESFTVDCEDGRLRVAMDRRVLQSSSVPVAAVTLGDQTCQAQSNGSHFLLVFPVISCGTEGLLLQEPRGVQYNNTILLWKDNPQTILGPNRTDKSKVPLSIRFSCFAPIPNPAEPPTAADDDVNTSQTELAPLVPDPVLAPLPKPRVRSGPILLLKLFVTENYEETRIGPCIVTAGHRVYVEISARAPLAHSVEVNSCIISPLSDPKKSPFWTVISDGCSSDPSLTLSTTAEHEEEEEEETEQDSRLTERKERMKRDEEQIPPLRYSFVLRPVYNDSMQFLHCSLRLCASDAGKGEAGEETAKEDCLDKHRIPPLVSGSHKHQCEIRNLSRPMVVTRPISSLARKARNPAGQRTKRLSVAPPPDSPEPENTITVVQTGLAMGIVFAAFVMGVGLMGGLWCIYNHTRARPAALQECYLTDQTYVGRNIWSLPSPSGQSSSSV